MNRLHYLADWSEGHCSATQTGPRDTEVWLPPSTGDTVVLSRMRLFGSANTQIQDLPEPFVSHARLSARGWAPSREPGGGVGNKQTGDLHYNTYK